ncbi:zf-HC2 domain-containing protein [Ammoniphilus sp. YIM 78166]|uniref:zf-HC2 domain-containing protein n=1 Tax=Ammoniphilus sp. YIM 78166 TaxID=1644106 RepID=UPI00106F726D|nr:zf-HC2 domain-containing protein [Ammoniphilus sp. YIM 78166]
MRCEEVVDFMQRSFDHDLSPEELSLMEEHLCSCSECQKLYEDLKALHLQLESLPDVEPPKSLVDAILPALHEPKESLPSPVPPPLKARKLIWKSWSYWIGGAAAVILLLLTAPQLMKEPELNMAGVEEKADQSLMRSMEIPAEQENQPEMARKSTESANENDPQQDMASLAVPEPQVLQKDNQPQNHETSDKEDSAIASKRAIEPDLEKPTKPQDTENMAMMAIPETVPEEQARVEEGPTMSLMAEQPEEKKQQPGRDLFFSPNGNWSAHVEGQQVIVADLQGNEVFRSHEWKGTVYVSVEWIDDQTVLYTLFPVNGTQGEEGVTQPEKWTIDLKQGQEQKQ